MSTTESKTVSSLPVLTLDWCIGTAACDCSDCYEAHEENAVPEDACPGCGRRPGDGVSASCTDALGCGYWKAVRQ